MGVENIAGPAISVDGGLSLWSCEGHSLILTACSDGFTVSQYNQNYKVRNRRLTADLVDVIKLFCAAGFAHVIRDAHPHPKNRDSGVVYLVFSSSASEFWIAVVDASSGQWPIERLTVNAKLRDILIAHRIPFSWESAGGKNMFLARSDLELFLSVVTPAVSAELAQTSRRRARGNFPRVALSSEYALQVLCCGLAEANELSFVNSLVKEVIVNPKWPRGLGGNDPQAYDIPDLVLSCSDAVWVIELKLNEIDDAAVDQVCRYVQNRNCIELAGSRPIKAVAIGNRLRPGTNARGLASRGIQVDVWLYTWSPDNNVHFRRAT